VFAVVISIFVAKSLPETHYPEGKKQIPILEVALSLIKNRKVIGLGFIVAACNGISFSYFAEGSFYLIKLLGLSPSEYGLSFIAIATSTMLGGMLSKKLHNTHTSQTIMGYGLIIILISSSVLSCFVLLHIGMVPLSQEWMIAITIIAQMIIMFGVCMTTSNALALALVDYKSCIGTASSLFGFFYYCLISLFTLGMGILHNGTLLPMPLYFLGISIFMLLVQKLMLRSNSV
jgi:hypothetical protein